MRRAACLAGKFFQLAGMAILPLSLWIGFGTHNERASIILFVASLAVFAVGTLLTRVSARL